MDVPGLHKNARVPMLDLEVWVDHQEEKESDKGAARADILCWSFYKKPITSSRVLNATTAYSWRAKLT